MASRKKSARSTSIDGSGEPHIVYIHGIGEHPPAESMKRAWDLALFGRDMGERTRLAYWANILHPPLKTTSARAAAVRRRAEGTTLDADALLAQAGVDPDDPAAQALAESLLAAMGALPLGQAEGPRAKGVRKKVLPLPAFLRKPIARRFLEALVKDTAAYFFRDGVRAKVHERLLAALPRDGRPVVLVSHSQGTIVSYEVLSALAKKGKPLEVVQLVTLGSPLGIREVQDFLDPSTLAVPRPTVRAWANFSDLLDPVALDKGLAGDFDPDGFIHDDLIENADVRRLEGFNPHSAVGYLAHPRVRKVVHRAARFDSHARFLVARDVAAHLAVEARQPVLVELLEPGNAALGGGGGDDGLDLRARVANAAAAIEKIVVEAAGANAAQAKVDARVDPLRRFVAAHLMPSELEQIAARHAELRIYAMWKSAQKKKLIHRSAPVVHVDAARASYGAHGDRIRWAVLDTGVQAAHPHFAGRIDAVWDCTRKGPPQRLDREGKRAVDRDGHGTHVAGIIAGEHIVDGRAYRAMAPRASLVVYKVLNDDGEGEDAWIIKALDHIAEQNESHSELYVDGLNLSLGGPFDATVYGCGFSAVCVELRRLWRAGVLAVVASGNEGVVAVTTPDGELDLNAAMSIGDPANLEDCIAVGSVNADRPHLYGISSFSSRGPTADGRVKPDVVAPGERIRSANARFRKTDSSSLYREESGTSMAAPHVSGLLAAFLSVRREYRGRPDEVKALLLRTCTDIGRDRYHQGKGIPNLMKMLLEA